MRLIMPIALIATLAAAACAPAARNDAVILTPGYANTGAGVGFDDYATYEQQRIARDAALRGGGTDNRVITAAELGAAGLPVAGGDTLPQGDPGAPFGAATAAPTQPVIAAPAPIASGPISSGPVDVNNPGISDEQDFEAVSSRQTIESDRQRLEAQAQSYQVIPPTALPQRSGSAAPNIVAYALSSTNSVGQSIYQRSGFNAAARSARACGRFASPDLAQEDFLANGGPQNDRKLLDPDGDGFACGWDPRPFRAVRN